MQAQAGSRISCDPADVRDAARTLEGAGRELFDIVASITRANANALPTLNFSAHALSGRISSVKGGLGRLVGDYQQYASWLGREADWWEQLDRCGWAPGDPWWPGLPGFGGPIGVAGFLVVRWRFWPWAPAERRPCPAPIPPWIEPRTDLEDPGTGSAQSRPQGKTPMPGPIFDGGVQASDVRQGALGDCYFAAAAAAIAMMDPERIRQMMTENPDGTVTVRFADGTTVTVDRDVYTGPSGEILYGQPGDRGRWFPILEKAYAQKHGSYGAVEGADPKGGASKGGDPKNALHELVGGSPGSVVVDVGHEDGTWRALKAAVDHNWPTCASTHASGAIYANSGVYADHAYTVLGLAERDGHQFVKLRNPWGPGSGSGRAVEPAGNGPQDGVFELSLPEFCRLFGRVAWAQV